MVTSETVYRAILKELKHYNTTSMTPEEFNYHIWIAELEYVKDRYWAHEKHQKQIDDLDVIRVITDGIAGAPIPLPNEGANVAGQEYINMPEDYLHLLAVGVKVTYFGEECKADGSQSPDHIAATPLKDDKRYVAETDYYSLPRAEWPNLYYTQRLGKMVFRAGQSIVNEVKLSYLRYPLRIVFDPLDSSNNVDSEFGEAQTNEIVELCVESYLETIESRRTSSFVGIKDRNFNQFPPPNVPT